MSLESIAYLLAAIPVVHKWLKTQATLAETASHAIAQNTEILGRQTAILEALVPIVPLIQELSERVSALETESEEETVVSGFRVDEEEDEDNSEDEVDPVNIGFARSGSK